MSFTRCAFLLLVGWVAACTGDVERLTPGRKQTGSSNDAVPTLAVVQTKRPPSLDGSLDDPIWSFANTTRTFVETRKGGIAPIQASAKLLWDRRYLYVGVDVHDALLRASHTERDAHLWEQDCVELMERTTSRSRSHRAVSCSTHGTTRGAFPSRLAIPIGTATSASVCRRTAPSTTKRPTRDTRSRSRFRGRRSVSAASLSLRPRSGTNGGPICTSWT
ncbi:MAG: carbohydrate-binding family 9-like protein [Deltaproteobacteria bacterium]|nr:carbohydrate-binding family 9-like protein [Deltaproteobacteria bacterium]